MLGKRCFCLANIHSRAPDLNLKILAPEKYHAAMFRHLPQVARKIELFFFCSRFKMEFLPCQFGFLPIPRGKESASHSDFSELIGTDVSTEFVQQTDFHTVYRITYGDTRSVNLS